MQIDDRKRKAGPQTAIALKALLASDRFVETPFDEIRRLADTAGLQVIETFSQRLDRPRAATYLGKGKVREAAERAKQLDVDVILTDNDLSPAQERNLEKITDRIVIDRSQLIMDIFAQRAHSYQAQLQVELAQLRYSFPRLKRLWTHLSRYEGGIGMRGPGETQLETDKRLVRKRIQRLERELRDIERRKVDALRHRQGEFVVALVGYTNAGKSTLLNRLTESAELVEDKLFATLDTRVRRWQLAPNRYVLVTDTVGFIRDLPHHLVASFHATLAETQSADLLFHVADASSTDAPWQLHTVQSVLRSLDCGDKEQWLILNKWDSVPDERMIDARHLVAELGRSSPLARDGGTSRTGSEVRSIAISARSGFGIDTLRDEMIGYLRRFDSAHELAVPHARGDVVSYLRENAEVTSTDYRDDAVHVVFSISPAREARLRRIFPEGFAAAERRDPWD